MKDPIPSPLKKKSKDNQSFVEGLRTEWNLFWENILGDDEKVEVEKESQDAFITGKLEKLSIDQVKIITKALSADRRKLNQKLEKLNKELEESSSKAENLSLVGGDPNESRARISELSEMGIKISEELHKINDRLKIARRREDQLKREQRKNEI